jgi:hypothetical protein
MLRFLTLGLLLLLIAARPFDNASDVVNKAEQKATALDEANKTLNCDFVQTISVERGTQKTVLVYNVSIRNGKESERKLVSNSNPADTLTLRTMDRMRQSRGPNAGAYVQKPLLFPYLAARRRESEGDRKVSFEMENENASMGGKTCYLVKFTFEVQSEQASVEGSGKLWIAKDDHHVVRTESEMTFESQMGTGKQKAFIDVGEPKSGVPMIVRQERQSTGGGGGGFGRGGGVGGPSKTVTENSQFKFL